MQEHDRKFNSTTQVQAQQRRTTISVLVLKDSVVGVTGDGEHLQYFIRSERKD
jgi:hypothetical protein